MLANSSSQIPFQSTSNALVHAHRFSIAFQTPRYGGFRSVARSGYRHRFPGDLRLLSVTKRVLSGEWRAQPATVPCVLGDSWGKNIRVGIIYEAPSAWLLSDLGDTLLDAGPPGAAPEDMRVWVYQLRALGL